MLFPLSMDVLPVGLFVCMLLFLNVLFLSNTWTSYSILCPLFIVYLFICLFFTLFIYLFVCFLLVEMNNRIMVLYFKASNVGDIVETLDKVLGKSKSTVVRYSRNQKWPAGHCLCTSISMKTECDYLNGWIEKRSRTQKSHPEWWTLEI